VTAGVLGGAHNAAGTPGFLDPPHDNYHITVASAARDTGVNAGVTTDIDGDARPVNSGVDMGYDEYSGLRLAAQADSYHTTPNTPLLVAAPGVLANDSDSHNDPLSAVLTSGPMTGTVVVATTGAFTYTAPIGFIGSVTFTYQASDGLLFSTPAVVTITVSPFKLYLPLVRR
jgi:hypothetical protein